MATRQDVVVVGYGPVGQGLAIMLAQQGHRVLVVERKPEPYPLPRAVCMDHEIRRVLLAIGCGDVVERNARPSPAYRWLNARREELLSIDWTVEAVSGGPEAYFFHQPSLEAALQARAAEHRNVDVRLGWELEDFSQDEDGVSAGIREIATGRRERISARYLIGADGANSFVRRALGIGQRDFGFEADWLVVDVSAPDDESFGTTGALQICDPMRPTTMVPGGTCMGRVFRRWEFMRLPGEPKEALEDPETVWALLAPWIGPSRVQLHKHVVYTFRSLVAEKWREDRVLLAGDAAHVMPPFMGQGMCSGLRDDWNLVWRLDLALRGICNQTILDDYEFERKDHVAAVIDASVALGRIICVADSDMASARDDAFLSGAAPEIPPFPWLRVGFIATEPCFTRLAGRLSPHDLLTAGEASLRLDERTGRRFVLITTDDQAIGGLVEVLNEYGPFQDEIAIVGPDELPIGSSIRRFLEDDRLSAILVRPDFYIYGSVSEGEPVSALVHAFLADLTPKMSVFGRSTVEPVPV